MLITGQKSLNMGTLNNKGKRLLKSNATFGPSPTLIWESNQSIFLESRSSNFFKMQEIYTSVIEAD